jgi:GNAT superfamily N-acetyltransferase
VRISFRFKYAVAQTMAFEKEYHRNLQYSLEEKRALLKGAIAIWMFDEGEMVGEAYGVPLNRLKKMPPGCPRDAKGIYCCSNTILKKYQGKGYGRILKAAFIGRVSRDFRKIYGHARAGGSQRLNESFGAKLGKRFENWQGSGEEYRVYTMVVGR